MILFLGIIVLVLIVSFVVGGIWVFGGRKMRSSSMDIVESGYVKYDAEVPNFRTNEYLERELWRWRRYLERLRQRCGDDGLLRSSGNGCSRSDGLYRWRCYRSGSRKHWCGGDG